MGCEGSSTSRYIESEYEEENEIRHFEEETLKCFSKSFSYIIQRLAIEKDYIPHLKLEEFIQKEFGEEMRKVIGNEYFDCLQDSIKHYDAHKIKCLIYLLCVNNVIKVNGVPINDKVSFIYSNIKMNPDELMSKPLNIEDSDWGSFMDIFVDISCDIMVAEYQKTNPMKKGKEIEKLRGIKDQIVKKYLNDVFTVNNKQENMLDYKAIEMKFNSNPFIFTTGDIRRCGFNILFRK